MGLVQERRLVEGIRVGEYSAGLVGVELPGSGADQHGGHRIAGEVGQCWGLGHEPVDAIPASLTPAASFDLMIMKNSREVCSPAGSGWFIAAAMNRVAMVR